MRARSTGKAERLEKSRALQAVLYRSAKQDPNRRFHALYDKVARSDVLARAWGEVCTASAEASGTGLRMPRGERCREAAVPVVWSSSPSAMDPLPDPRTPFVRSPARDWGARLRRRV